ncbi:unnamed protein product, partial [Rangifer tarandus platyrhynchus]
CPHCHWARNSYLQSTERVMGASTSPAVTGYTSGVPFIQKHPGLPSPNPRSTMGDSTIYI